MYVYFMNIIFFYNSKWCLCFTKTNMRKSDCKNNSAKYYKGFPVKPEFVVNWISFFSP